MQKETSWLKITKTTSYHLKSAGIMLIPVALYLVPVNWLNQQHTFCIFNNLFGFNCYGCGISRAILCALHLDMSRAFEFNKFVVIVMPLLMYLWAKMLGRSLKRGISAMP